MTTHKREADNQSYHEDIVHIGQVMTRMRLLVGRRLIGRLAVQNVAPGLELSHLDVLDAVRRAETSGEVTVGAIAEILRIDPSRASRIVAEMVTRGVLRRKASQADARRIVVAITALAGSWSRKSRPRNSLSYRGSSKTGPPRMSKRSLRFSTNSSADTSRRSFLVRIEPPRSS